MIREEVLKVWTGLKEKLNKEREFCQFVGDKMYYNGVIPDFSISKPNDSIGEHLPEWSSSWFKDKVESEKKEVNDKADLIGESELSVLQLAYFNFANMFQKLVHEAERHRSSKRSWWRLYENLKSKTIELKEEVNRSNPILTPEMHLKQLKAKIDFLFPFDE